MSEIEESEIKKLLIDNNKVLKRRARLTNFVMSLVIACALSLFYFFYGLDNRVHALELKEVITQEWKDEICVEFEMANRVSRNAASDVKVIRSDVDYIKLSMDKKADLSVVENMANQINMIYKKMMEK